MTGIIHAESSFHLVEARELFLEYAASLDFSLRFQGFDREAAALPGEYAPPGGALLLAVEAETAIGCVALRRIDGRTCEMKRLYVRPGARGRGVGRLLAEAVLVEARRIGYARMKLDTVASMDAANALYRSLGFVSTTAYRFNPLDDARYLALDL